MPILAYEFHHAILLCMKAVDQKQTKLFLDSGNPKETEEALSILGFLDGQTTNPSLVAKNPHILELMEKKELNDILIWEKYKEVANEIQKVIPTGAISVEVFADNTTSYETMLAKGRELASWFPGIYVKLPITEIGLRTANTLAAEGTNINMTLCFTQEQAAAVHAATKGAKHGQVFVSPFIGRLDDIGLEGFDVVQNIKKMYQEWGSHVLVLGASVRNLAHVKKCRDGNINIITAPLSVYKEWAADPELAAVVMPEEKSPIEYKELPEKEWTSYDIHHDLTDKGIEKFAYDWKKLFE